MPLSPLTPTDTRSLFRPVSSELVVLLRRLQPLDWQRPTVAGAWAVRDVVAHLVDLTLRRLSFERDGYPPRRPSTPIVAERDLVAFINSLNAEWVSAAARCSPRVLTDLFDHASRDLADWFEARRFEAPALFAVSWAGEETSEGWFDVGREFTELWHHQEQIRMAVGASSIGAPRYLRAVIEIAIRGLPHAYRHVDAKAGQTVVIEVSGAAGGKWTLSRQASRWTLHSGEPSAATTRIRLPDAAAGRLLFNALSEHEAITALEVDGSPDLAAPLLKARSVIV
jgi:uncharacterized protein (TIGR03083 family)